MKQKILDLITQQKLSKQECNIMIEELNQIASSKISKEEYKDLQELKSKYIEESAWRAVFINQLESLL